MSKTFKIRPLEWRQADIPNVMEAFTAEALGESYSVYRRMVMKKWGPWFFRWDSYEDYGHSFERPCETPEKGKSLAWDHFLARLVPVLEEVGQ